MIIFFKFILMIYHILYQIGKNLKDIDFTIYKAIK